MQLSPVINEQFWIYLSACERRKKNIIENGSNFGANSVLKVQCEDPLDSTDDLSVSRSKDENHVDSAINLLIPCLF